MLIFGICFFSFWLLHSLWQTLGQSKSLLMISFCYFLWLSSIPLYICIYCIFFIHSSVVGHLGFFHLLAIVNSAAVSIGVYMPFWIMVFLGYMSSSGVCRLLTGASLLFLEFYSWSAPFWKFFSPCVCNKGQNLQWWRRQSCGRFFTSVMLLWMMVFVCRGKVPGARADSA